MTKNVLTLGDMPKDQQDRCFEGDPTEEPFTQEREDRAKDRVFDYNRRSGFTPEQAYPHDPDIRAEYRKYLCSMKG